MTDERALPPRAGGLRIMRGVLLSILLALAILAPLSAWAVVRISGESRANCDRIHTLTMTLDGMIADGRESLDAYLRDGTITREQHERELARIERQRVALAGADCPPRSGPAS